MSPSFPPRRSSDRTHRVGPPRRRADCTELDLKLPKRREVRSSTNSSPHVRVGSYSLSSITIKYPNLALKPSQGGPRGSTCGCHSFPMSTLEPWALPPRRHSRPCRYRSARRVQAANAISGFHFERVRSEATTSEPQSQMTFPYATSCL